jgi:hypothetical protein
VLDVHDLECHDCAEARNLFDLSLHPFYLNVKVELPISLRLSSIIVTFRKAWLGVLLLLDQVLQNIDCSSGSTSLLAQCCH